jgi:hypothetical protein
LLIERGAVKSLAFDGDVAWDEANGGTLACGVCFASFTAFFACSFVVDAFDAFFYV